MSDQSADFEFGLPGDALAPLEAVVAISSDLDLHSVLNRIVESACRITQARYGALGVLDTGVEATGFQCPTWPQPCS